MVLVGALDGLLVVPLCACESATNVVAVAERSCLELIALTLTFYLHEQFSLFVWTSRRSSRLPVSA